MEETQLRRFEFLNENDRNKIMQAQENSDFRTDYKRMCEKNIRFVPYFSGEYPEPEKLRSSARGGARHTVKNTLLTSHRRLRRAG